MVDRGASDAAPPPTPAAPVVKRKRGASCLGEQERRERKRAVDREAQRSLREKTKTHIAELERTIQLLRNQDRSGATASLLSEVEALRTENERLRGVIESVRSVVGGGLLSCNAAPANSANGGGGDHSSAASSIHHPSPKRRAISFTPNVKLLAQTPLEMPSPFEPIATTARSLDLDGMTVIGDVTTSIVPSEAVQMFQSVTESPEEEVMDEAHAWENSPATATWVPLMEEFFGPDWRCPSPVALHVGNPGPPACITPNAKCPLWKKANELYGKVFKYHMGTASFTALQSDAAEAGLLYLGIKHGWNMLPDHWMQSPALVIQKQVDELLFRHLPKMNRLAIAYKSLKLVKYYLQATKETLYKVPKWLRPSHGQSITKHPVAIDFFAWPTLRDRLVSYQDTIFKDGEFSRCYSHYVHFDWPFSFEDAFFHDETTGTYYPSPLFERYHNDLQYWTVDPKFAEKFPEVGADIDMDRRRFTEIESA